MAKSHMKNKYVEGWEGDLSRAIERMLSSTNTGIRQSIDSYHTEDTPTRVIDTYLEMFAGCNKKPQDALSTLFPSDNCKEMIHVKDIAFFSTCAHHHLIFFGQINFAYIPEDSIVGLSKIPRLVEVYAKRPQVQEKLGVDIVNAFQNIVIPHGCAIMIRAFHMCCASRGIKQPTSYTETTALRGVFATDTSTKAEFLASCNAPKWSA
jgi:GTP cyclohydrolase IA